VIYRAADIILGRFCLHFQTGTRPCLFGGNAIFIRSLLDLCSNMSADWSAIRRRQTLGEVQNHAAVSQIPQPSSVFKKSAAGRASVAPGGVASLGPAPPRSSLAPQRFFRSSSGGNSAGDAVSTGPLSSSQTSNQRESLRNSRQSYAPQASFK
jgi:hypothetical protein